ncbi:MAG: DNA translocase FtsK, partial [Solirubrobacteraceae bacterium MAG38_C4-C5]|nr:DNA translocase FtsK [Candidatus Siliceabacter maunaloa]
ALRPLRAGALCLFAGVTLALAAGTLGLGPGGAREGLWEPAVSRPRGGIAGEALFWASSSLFSTVGAHILALFLLAAAVLLLTGATIAGVVRTTGTSIADHTRILRTPRPKGEEPSQDEPEQAPDPPPQPFGPPEPEGLEPIVRATHVEAPSLDAVERYPDLFGDGTALTPDDLEAEEEPESEPAARAEAEPGPPSLDEQPTVSIRAEDLTPQGRLRGTVTDDPAFQWKLPLPRRVLTRSTAEQAQGGPDDVRVQQQTAAQLVEALGHFGVESKIVGTVAGPHITRYELRLAPGIKMSKVAQLKDDLAYALAAVDIRILAPIPGKTAVGIEVPNLRRRIVHLGDVFQEAPEGWSPLTVWLGKDVAGKAIGADLAKMPHILVAGTTGAGKSGAVNAMLSSLLLRATPHELRLVLVDPKQVELNHYESIPHLLTPVITSPRKAANALQNLVREMEDRYAIMALAKTRSLPELNRHRGGRGDAPLPYILCIIDELADLMMVAPADVEDSIIRLAQKARAVGIHLVLATQSPRVDVITGMIKANVPSRIAFAVSSQTDSRVILDQNGAESLLGQGDMLFSPVGSSRLQRIQGAYIDEAQIEQLTDFWRRQGEPELREELLDEVEAQEGGEDAPGEFDPDEDPLLPDAIRLVAEMQTASTSMLQRRLRLGYTRAGRLIDMLERRGVISGYEGSKPRQVLVAQSDVDRVVAALGERADEPTTEVELPESEPVGAEDRALPS